MLKKLYVLILTQILIVSTFLIVYNDFEAIATSGGGDGEGEWVNETMLDYKFVWKTTRDFADVVHNDEIWGNGSNVIRKGRAFGTPGDKYTATYIETELKELELDPVRKLTLGPVKELKYILWEYTSKVETIDFNLIVNHPDWNFTEDGQIPRNETFVFPSACDFLSYNSLTFNNTFNNITICPKNFSHMWLFDGILSNCYLNLTNITVLNEFLNVIGNVSYIENANELPQDQEGKIFLIEDEEGCNETLDNITNATGVILFFDDQGEGTPTEYDFYNFTSQAVRVNKSENNLTTIIEMLEDDTFMIADNTVDNYTLTFIHNFSYLCNSWPADDFIIIGKFIYNVSDWEDIYPRAMGIRLVNWLMSGFFNKGKCHGFIIYGLSNNTHGMDMTSRLWMGWSNLPGKGQIWKYVSSRPAVQIFSVNGTVGKFLVNHSSYPNCNISGHLEQKYTREDHTPILQPQQWKAGVEAYNVEGNLTIEKSPDDAIIVLSNRFDGWWGECPGDSGAGGGIILGIAKYFKEHKIIPKYNLTFLFTTGEEYGMRGAWHYSHSHPEDDFNVIKWIGADQLGFFHPEPGPTNLIGLCSDDTDMKIINFIGNESGYNESFSDYNFTTVKNEMGIAQTDSVAWMIRENCSTICMVKGGWSLHHNAGENYIEGDSMKNMDHDDVNTTFNITWQVVKYYCVNPDTWFDDTSWDYNISDSEDLCSFNDTVTVEFNVTSTLPHDKVMLNTSLIKYNPNATDTTVMYKIMNFTVNRSWIIKNVSFTLGDDDDSGCHYLKFDLHNSTGRINETLKLSDNNINVTKYSDEMFFLWPNNSCGNPPDITNISATPNTLGFGFNVTISADVIKSQEGGDVDAVEVIISNPFYSMYENFTMNNTENDTYEYIFNNTWKCGKYSYLIWAIDENGNESGSEQKYFYVKTKAAVSVCTIKDSYSGGEIVNLTDPPGNNDNDSQNIGYEFLDDGKVLRIWNRFDSYYFNTSNGIQFTNHKDDYWSHNVLMLGYYNNDVWNLIYRTDNLGGFNKNITSDDETFVNATLWKVLTYGGYDFRLAIRYYLGVDDNELTVIPYIKNLDEDDIPYVLGFGWEIKDIQIDMTPSGDYIEINGTSYFLNQTLDETYKNTDSPCYFIKEDSSDTKCKSLYLRWDENLNYRVRVKSRNGQYNAPITLFIRIGTLDTGQEKYTELYWYDADQITYYFDDYYTNESWPSNPGYMVDGNENTYASVGTSGTVQLCDNNTCNGSYLGSISKMELRVKGYRNGFPSDIILRPVYNGITDGNEHTFNAPAGTGNWSEWFDIPAQTAKGWTWSEIKNLDCDVESDCFFGDMFTLYCSKVELRVTYTTNYAPQVSNPYPESGSTGIALTPMLNITVSDLDGDLMNITWRNNSSGSWQVFGTNNNVSNGTYQKVFSNATVNGQWWYWNVTVNDGKNYTESDILSFYTGFESKIYNTGNTNFSGYLLMRIDYYNETSEEWEVDTFVIDDKSTSRVINVSEKLPLDTIFNLESVNTSSFSHGNGTYRVYAALCDPWNNVLYVCDDFQAQSSTWWYLENWYEFTVTGI